MRSNSRLDDILWGWLSTYCASLSELKKTLFCQNRRAFGFYCYICCLNRSFLRRLQGNPQWRTLSVKFVRQFSGCRCYTHWCCLSTTRRREKRELACYGESLYKGACDKTLIKTPYRERSLMFSWIIFACRTTLRRCGWLLWWSKKVFAEIQRRQWTWQIESDRLFLFTCFFSNDLWYVSLKIMLRSSLWVLGTEISTWLFLRSASLPSPF